MSLDFYDLLGVDRDASPEEIRQAFRRQVRKYHPDRNDDPRAPAQFAALKEAYNTLGDEKERDAYDRLGHDEYVEKRTSGLPSMDSWEIPEEEIEKARDDGDDDGGGPSGETDRDGKGSIPDPSVEDDWEDDWDPDFGNIDFGDDGGDGSGLAGGADAGDGSGLAGGADADGGPGTAAGGPAAGPGEAAGGDGPSGTGTPDRRVGTATGTDTGPGGTTGSGTGGGGSGTAAGAGVDTGTGSGTDSSGTTNRSGGSAGAGSPGTGTGTADGTTGPRTGGRTGPGTGAGRVAGVTDDADYLDSGDDDEPEDPLVDESLKSGAGTAASTGGRSLPSPRSWLAGLRARVGAVNLGWGLVLFADLVYLAGLGLYARANAAGVSALASDLSSGSGLAGAPTALATRHGVEPLGPYITDAFVGDPPTTLEGYGAPLLVAGAVLLPLVYGYFVSETRSGGLAGSWHPSYAHLLPALAPLVGVAVALGAPDAVPGLYLELVALTALPGLAVLALPTAGLVLSRFR